MQIRDSPAQPELLLAQLATWPQSLLQARLGSATAPGQSWSRPCCAAAFGAALTGQAAGFEVFHTPCAQRRRAQGQSSFDQ